MPTYSKASVSTVKPLRPEGIKNKLIMLGLLLFFVFSLGLVCSRVICFFTEEFRTPISSSAEFDDKCVSDSINFMNDVDESNILNGLSSFFESTGVQPYVVFHQYEPNMKTKVEMEEYARNWYKYEIKNESSFLCMYFAGENDAKAGTLVHVCGEDIDSVMDDNAINVFYKNIDKYWSESDEIGIILSNAFAHTASDIMYSIWDNVILLLLGVAGIVIAGLLFFIYDNHFAK